MNVNATEFKAKCLKLLDEVTATHPPLVITKRGRPAARVVPIDDGTARIGGYALVTRDRKILDYGKTRHVNVLAV